MILLAEGPAPPVQTNTIGLKLLFSTSRIRSYFNFLYSRGICMPP